MLEPAEVLAYLAQATSLGDICDVSADCIAAGWKVPVEELRTGVLSSHLTRKILLSYSARHKDVAFGSQSIPVACALRVLASSEGKVTQPLLCVGAMLDPNGALSPRKDFGVWIPRKALDATDLHGEDFAVCDLDTYRAHQQAMESLPEDGTWGTKISRAEDLFASVNALSEDVLQESGTHIEDETCVIWLWERPADARIASTLMDGLARNWSGDSKENDACSVSGPISKLVNAAGNGMGRGEYGGGEQLPDDALLSPKLLCGIIDHLPQIGIREHDALAAFAQENKGDVLSVSAPQGTNGDALVLAAMANLLTECALRGDKAPLMCCVAPMHTLDSLVRPVSARPTTGQVALSSRWIPRIAVQQGAEDTPNGRKTLGTLPALFVLHSADGTAAATSSSCIVRSYGHMLEDELALYRDPWYVPKATTYFLDCVAGFTKQRFHTIAQARAKLAEILRRVDQERSELIDAYATVCKASELLRQRDGLVARIGRLRRGHTICKDRLEFWQALASEQKSYKQILAPVNHDQSKIIAQNAQRGESLALGKGQISDVVDAYSKELLRIETSIDRLRGASANLSTRIRAASPEGSRCARIIETLADLCRLTQDQKALLDATIDGRGGEVTLHYLQDVLDKTIRPAEFWMAMHIYESRWISYANYLSKQARAHNDIPADLWENMPNLCPFNLVPDDISVGIVQEVAGERRRIDVAFVLEAGSIGVAKGLSIASMSERLVALGSEATLGARAPMAKTYDQIQCISEFGDDAWARLDSEGVCVSSGRPFHTLVNKISNIDRCFLCDTRDSYGELDDLRSDLFPHETLRTGRMPASSADDSDYALRGIVPSLSYVHVPDSSWRKVGASRINQSEALAIGRWLKNHARDVKARYGRCVSRAPIAVISPFKSQSKAIELLIGQLGEDFNRIVESVALEDVKARSWPFVILSATCGPEAYEGLCYANGANVIALSATAAQDALLLFAGNAWMRCSDETARRFFSKATRVGRLFSKPRVTSSSTIDTSSSNPELNVRLRSKPVSITAFVRMLFDRGELSFMPTAAEANKALAKAGLIERVRLKDNRSGWRPTAAGKEAGIVAVRDKNNNPFCAYTTSCEAVVCTALQSMHT